MKSNTLTSNMLPNIDPFAIGFDKVFDRLQGINSLSGQSTYPPYNIIKLSDEEYLIEIACAGFDMDDFDIEVLDRVLTITGNVGPGDPDVDYVHKGIAARSFARKFTLSDTVEVEGATFKQGMLNVVLRNVIPEERKPRKIAIASEKQLLSEGE